MASDRRNGKQPWKYKQFSPGSDQRSLWPVFILPGDIQEADTAVPTSGSLQNSGKQLSVRGKMSDITETVKSKTQKEVVPPNAQYLSSAGGSALGTAAVWRQEWAIPSLACPEMQARQNYAMQMPTCFLLLCNCRERSVAVPTTCVPKMSRSKGKPLSCWFWPCAVQIKLQSSSLVCWNCQLCHKTCFLK